MEPLVLYSTENGVARLTFNRPAQRNAMSLEMMAVFHEKLERAASDPSVRCVVLAGAGGNFVAGGDIKSWAELSNMPGSARAENFRQKMASVKDTVVLLGTIDKPVITAVQGHAAGAGLSFVVAADLVVAAEDAQFHFANIHAALVPDMGISYYLPRIVGERQAMRLSLLGSRLDAVQAQAVGLVGDVVPVANFEAAVAELAAKLASAPATAIAETIKLLRFARHSSLDQQILAEGEGIATCAADDDFLAAIKAFTNRRPAKS